MANFESFHQVISSLNKHLISEEWYIVRASKIHQNSISLRNIEGNVVSNIALFYPTPLLEIFSFFLICYYTIKTIDDWDWGISNDCWKLVLSYQF